MLALAGGDLAQALLWTEWTRDFNLSVFSPQRENYYRCLHGLLLLAQDTEREPAHYHAAFERMYGAETLESAAAALQGKHCFAGLFTIDGDLLALPAHRALLAAYEKLQSAKRRHWQ